MKWTDLTGWNDCAELEVGLLLIFSQGSSSWGTKRRSPSNFASFASKDAALVFFLAVGGGLGGF